MAKRTDPHPAVVNPQTNTADENSVLIAHADGVAVWMVLKAARSGAYLHAS